MRHLVLTLSEQQACHINYLFPFLRSVVKTPTVVRLNISDSELIHLVVLPRFLTNFVL